MKFYNKIDYCKISFPHIGEIDFTSALNLPIIYNPVLDETLDTATIKLTDLRKADFPTVDVDRAFEPFTTVRIGFVGQETEIRMLIAHDDCKMQRKDGTDWRSWSHTIQLVEETKQLERESVDVLTFTNPVERVYDSNMARWSFYEGIKGGNFHGLDGAHISETKLSGWEFPELALWYTEKDANGKYKITINDNASTAGTPNQSHLSHYRFYLISPSGKFVQKEYDANKKNEHFYSDTTVEFDNLTAGTYNLYLVFSFINTAVGSTNDYLHMAYLTYVFVGDPNKQIKNYTLSEVITRLLSLTPTRTLSEGNRYKFDAEQLDSLKNEESPEFAFTGHTLFEAMLQIAQYKGAFPELKDGTVSFRKLWNGKFLTEKELPPSIDEINSSDIDQYCTYIETEVQNLVGMNDSRVSTVTEPYEGGYKTTRSSGNAEISEDTALIPTSYNIYQHINLNMGWTNDKVVGDINPYVYEQSEYESLSDTSGAYPNSKAYAIKWAQMTKNYTEIAHRINSSVSSIYNAFTNPVIVNVAEAKGTTIDSSIVSYLKRFISSKDSDANFANLMFQSKYIPIFNARIKQYKDNFGEFHHDGSIKYNQTAELVDSEMYGEHLKQLIRKLGNATKRVIYIFDKIERVPKVGTVVDGYSVYDVNMSIRENEVIATVSYVKYAELSKYIGVKNAWKDSDISTDKFYNRAISVNKFLLFTHDKNKESTCDIFKEQTLQKLTNFMTPEPVTCVEATGYTEEKEEISTVILPVISLAIGNSLFFQWGYEDNYSAGYMSDKAPNGATNVLSGTSYYRAQKAVRYCDTYGRMHSYDFTLYDKGYVAKTSVLAQSIGHSLPLVPELAQGDYENLEPRTPYIAVKDLLVDKNSSEALTFSVQLHYCSDNENFIVGSGLTNFCSLIGGGAKNIRLYTFSERINIFTRKSSNINNFAAGGVGYGLGTCKFDFQSNRIKITLPDSIINFKSVNSWGLFGKDENDNWQIIFGENRDLNRDLEGSDFETDLYLLPMNKLEDFI